MCFSREHCTKNEVFIRNFFSKCDQIRRKLWIWSHLLKKSVMENLIFCAVECAAECANLCPQEEKCNWGKNRFSENVFRLKWVIFPSACGKVLLGGMSKNEKIHFFGSQIYLQVILTP